MDRDLQRYPILLLFPTLFLCALLFDKGSGFFATILSALISAYIFISRGFSICIDTGDAVALLIFLLVGFTMPGVTEALRKTVGQLARADEAKALLLAELAHRTKNHLTIISSAVTLQARAPDNGRIPECPRADKARRSLVSRFRPSNL